MFSNLGCHIIQFPSDRWGFVGSVPSELALWRHATEADVLGQRAQFAGDILIAPVLPTFDTEHEAREYASDHDVELNN